jgi:serine/threonine-protein kinase RsbW
VNAVEPATEHIETVELRIPRKAEWVAVARLAIAAVANRLAFSVEEIEDLKLAIAEACTTCIQDDSRTDPIDIVCEAESAALRVIVRDRAFDSASARPRALHDLPAERGLGIFIIQSLMDSVDFVARDDGPTDLVMTKRVSA